MKSDKQRILEAYSEDLKAMYTEGEQEKASDVKKWVVNAPKYVNEKHNIVDAYAMIAEEDNNRRNKMRILNDQILHESALNTFKEAMDKAKKDMDRYEEGSDLEDKDKYKKAKGKFNKSKMDYDECCGDEDMKEGEIDKEVEGEKPAPSPEIHDATGTKDGGDTTNGKISNKVMKDQYAKTMKEAKDEMDDADDDETMKEAFDKYKMAKKKFKETCGKDKEKMDELKATKHDATDTVDGGVVTKQDIGGIDDKKEMNNIKENREAYMKYAKGIIGDKDLSKMSDEDTKALFAKIDKGWNSADEPGKDGKK